MTLHIIGGKSTLPQPPGSPGLHLCLGFLKRKLGPNDINPLSCLKFCNGQGREYEECVQIEPTSEGSHHLESRTETWDHPTQPNMLLLSKGRSRSPKEHTDGMLGDVANKLPNGSRHCFGRHRFSLRVCDSKTFTEVFICVSALIPQDCRLRQHHQEVKWIPRDSQVS